MESRDKHNCSKLETLQGTLYISTYYWLGQNTRQSTVYIHNHESWMNESYTTLNPYNVTPTGPQPYCTIAPTTLLLPPLNHTTPTPQ